MVGLSEPVFSWSGWRVAARKGVEIESTAMRGLICCGLGLHHYDH
jgi:hypothetical protein